jgi:hypothetical protein
MLKYTKYDSILKLEKWQSSNNNNFCKNDIRLPSVKCHMFRKFFKDIPHDERLIVGKDYFFYY